MVTYSFTLQVTDPRFFPGAAPLAEPFVGTTGIDAAHAVSKVIDKLKADGFVVVDIGPVTTVEEE